VDTRNSRLKQGHQKHQIVTWPKAYLSRLLWKRFWDLKLKKVLKPCWGGYWLAKKVHFFSLDPLWNGYPEFAFTVPLTIRFHPKMRPDEGPVEGKSSGLNWCSPDRRMLSFEKKWSELCQGSLRKVQALEINEKYFRSPKKQRSFCLNLWWTGFKNFSKIQQFQLFIRISFRAIEEPFPYGIWSAALLVHYLEVSFEEF